MTGRLSRTVVWILLAAMLIGLLPPLEVAVAAAASTSAMGELIDSYAANGETFTLSEGSRIFVPSATEPAGELLQTVQLIQRQFAADGRPTSTPMPIVWGDESLIAEGDIVLVLDTGSGISADGYELNVGGSATVTAGNLRGLIYGANMLQKHLRYADSNSIAGFAAADTPDTVERTVSLDCGRKYYTKNWICNFIREMSWMGYNTLQLHFSDDSGFRMDFWDPEYYTDGYQPANDFSWICGSNYTSWTLSAYKADTDKGKYLTTSEIIEILETAKEYQIDVIPSFDSPAHMDYLTWMFEYYYDNVNSSYSFYSTYFGKTFYASSNSGKINYTNSKDWSTALYWPYYAAINIKQDMAKAFAFELYIDIANFFKEYAGSTEFSIGADEVNLSASLSSGYSFQWGYSDFVSYINELNTLLNGKGYTMRMYNDFMGSTTYGGSSYDYADNIEIMYWDSPHNPNSSTKSNHTEPVSYYVSEGRTLYNCIQTNTYYALRKTSSGLDARGTSSYTNNWTFYRSYEEAIFNEWYPADISEHGNYSEDVADVPAANLGGGYFLIWCDYACINTEVQIWNGVTESVYNSSTGKKVSQYYSLRDRMWSNIVKMWNWDINSSMTYTEYAALRDTFGAHPGLGSGTNACAEATTLPAGTAPVTGYTASCTPYDCYCQIQTVTDAPVMSLPCEADVDEASVELGSADEGTVFSSYTFYKNTQGELWYMVTVGTGETGYIHATDTRFYAPIVDDITLTGATIPSAHIKGKTFSVQGVIQSTRNTLTSVSVYIHSGFDVDGTVVTGDTATVTSNYYSLLNSTVDYNTSFGSVALGKNTYVISAAFQSTYANGDTVATYSGSVNLLEHCFYVLSSSVSQSSCSHSYTSTTLHESTCLEEGVLVTGCAKCGLVTESAIPISDHSYSAVTVPATCQEDGYTTYTCGVCGYSFVGDYVAAGHSWVAATCTDAEYCSGCGEIGDGATGHSYRATVIAPTCTEKGYTNHVCANCGDSYTTDTVAALGHSYSSVVTAPTCTEEGCTTYTCSTCGHSYSDGYAAALGHSYVSVVTEPTCTEDGYTTHTCSRCGDVTVDSYVAAPGHSYKTETVAPTCTEGGYTTYTCSVCGYSYVGDRKDALGHDWVAATCTDAKYCRRCETVEGTALGHNYVTVVTAPTCTESGYTTHTCTRCGDSYTTNPVAALGHNWVDATCTDAKYCTNCGETDGSALGHRYVSVVTAPTCTTGGYTTHTCSRCGNSYKNNIVAALGHNYVSVVTAPTCTEQGYTTHTCSRCDDTYTDSIVAALGHSWVEVTCTEPEHCTTCGLTVGEALGHNYISVVTNRTCTTDGYTTHTCYNCKDVYIDNIVPAPGHKWVEATCQIEQYCEVCGETVGTVAAHDYIAVVTPPTCTEDGYTTHTCSYCGKSYTDTAVDALGHNYESVSFDSTCTEMGGVRHTCSRCGDEYIDGRIPANGHSYESTVTDASCTEQGYTTYTCTACGYCYTGSRVAALGHAYKSSFVIATCTTGGYTTHTCIRCGDVYVDNYVDAKGHSWSSAGCTEERYCTVCGLQGGGALGHDYEANVTAPTCAEQGYTTYTCTVCGDSYTGDFVAALGHSWVAANCTQAKHCTVCGATEGNPLGHSYNGVVTAPTCTDRGYTTYTCTVCGDGYVGDTVDALGHSWVAATCTEKRHCQVCGLTESEPLGHSYKAVVTDPTCTESGYTTYTCSRCGDSYVGDTVDALGHSWVAATCTEAKHCDRCGEVEGTALGHNYVSVVTAPTCTAQGYTTHICSRCGDSYTDSTVAALGHDYDSVVTAPTCTAQGYTTHTCSRCENSYVGSTVAALGHKYNSAVTAPTCTTEGYTTHICTVCGDSYKDAIVDALGHSWVDATCTEKRHCPVCGLTANEPLGHDYNGVVTAPTCTEGGYTTYTCTRCGDSYTDAIVSALGHSWVAATCTEAKHCTRCDKVEGTALGHNYVSVVTAPTCTAQGYTTHTCTRCGNGYTDSTVAALGHNYVSAVTNPTCTRQGYTTHTCSRCANSYADSSVAALGHDYHSVVTAPTCAEQGYTTHTCSRCNNSYTDGFVDALGHSWVDATCTEIKYCDICGTKEGSPLGHSYQSVVTAPTCTEGGYTTHTCTRCGDTYTDSITAALGHAWEAATCTGARSCTRCGETDGEALGHDYQSAVTAPTCTEDGYTTHTCSRCDDSYTDSTVAALGHDYKSAVTAPTCTAQGYTTHTCSRCGGSYTDSLLPANGHSYADVTVEPTCTKGGYTSHTCGVCGDSYTDAVVAALGHGYRSTFVDATCTTEGYTVHTCVRCDDSYIDSYVDALGHSWVDATCTEIKYCDLCGVKEGSPLGHSYVSVVTPPTCTKGGYTTYTCSRCGDTYTGAPTAATGHSWVDATCTEPTHCEGCGLTEGTVSGHSYRATVVNPTCTVDGYTAYTCTVCGDSYTDDVVAATGHSWVDATCTAAKYCALCGKTDGAALGHSYESVVTAPTYSKGGYTTYTCTVCGYSYMDNPVAALNYLSDCSIYRCYCQIQVTAATPVMALPCTNEVVSNVARLGYAGKGELFSCSYFYKNTQGELWYKVTTEDGQEGYIRATDTQFYAPLVDDITITNPSKPSAHINGKSFSLSGVIRSTQNTLTTVTAAIYSGFGTEGTKSAGASAAVSGNYYSLFNSTVDNNTRFGDAELGENTYVISVTYQNQYADGDSIAIFTGSVNLVEHCFYSLKSSVSQSSCSHSYTETVVREATCAETGLKITGCATCGLVKETQIAALSHTWTNATCSETKHCTVCGASEGDTLDHSYSSSVIPAACTEEGYTLYTCGVCGDSYRDSFTSATGHSWVDATCTDPMYCANCGDVSGDVAGHSYKEIVVEATCTAKGSVTYVCTNCGDSYDGGTLPAAGHSWIEATCTEARHCSKCGLTVSTALGHIWVEATCQEVKHCTRCGAEEGTLANHSYQIAVIEASCTEGGFTFYACNVCGYSYSGNETEALGHTWKDGTCTVCGDVCAHNMVSGSCTECGYSQLVTPTLALSYASLSFEAEIRYNIYFTASDLDDVVQMGMLFFSTGDESGSYETASKIVTSYTANATHFMVQTDGVAAKNMGDNIYFRLFAQLTDGSYVYSALKSYNAVSYANSILQKSTNPYMKTLVVAMLNFGAEAQLYFNYNTDNLMNSGLTEEHQALVSEYSEDTMPQPDGVDAGKNELFTRVGFGQCYITASFDSAFALNYYFTTSYVPDDDLVMYYWTAEDYAAADTLTPENASGSMVMVPTGAVNQYWGCLSGIAAKEMSNTFYVGGIYTSGGETYYTAMMNYSMGRYCDTIAANDSSSQQSLAKMTAVYGYSAREYFASLQS